MRPSTSLPPPLSALEFYLLLALSRRNEYAYSLKGLINSSSLGSVKVNDGTLYPLLKSLSQKALIKAAGFHPTGKRSQPRLHYAITPEGKFRLTSDLHRLRHAIKTAESISHFQDETSPDISKLLDQLH